MNHAVDAITKIGRFVRVKDWNCRQFVSLLEERDGERSDRGYPKISSGIQRRLRLDEVNKTLWGLNAETQEFCEKKCRSGLWCRCDSLMEEAN